MSHAVASLAPRVFVDGSAWLAFMNRRDLHHGSARTLIDDCIARRVQMTSTNWTAYEALSMVKSRVGWQAASNLWSLFMDEEIAALVSVTEDIEARAIDLFLGFRDKSWGVVDCAGFIVMEDLGCREAIVFDHHFVEASRQRGFQLLS